MRSKNDCDVKREFWWRVRARARLSSLFGRERERRDGGFERNARKRTGRAGGRDGWMVARALLSAFSMRAMCTKVLLSLLFGATNIPPRWIDAKDSPPRSLSLSLFALAIDYNNNNSRKTRPKKTPWSPTRRKRRKKRSKSSPTVASTSNNSSN